MFKRGGGVKGLLNNVKKNCTFLKGWLPLHLFDDNICQFDTFHNSDVTLTPENDGQ